MSEHKTKVAIVGAGAVGSSLAFALLNDGSVSDITLIDCNKNKAEGEVLDLQHCMQFTRFTRLIGGDSFSLVEGADLVVVTAGKAQKQGQSRSDLLEENAALFADIIPQIVAHNKSCILLIVTNPLDVMTYLAYKLSGFSPSQVLGSGTVLDSARLRYLIGNYYDISPKDISAFVLGEHGDSEFVWWSGATIGGVGIHRFPQYNKKFTQSLFEQTRTAAYQVISKKGSTCYAIALSVVKIIRAIMLNQARVFSISSVMQQDDLPDISISVPTVVRGNGVNEKLPLVLDAEEINLFKISAQKIAEDIDKIKKFLT